MEKVNFTTLFLDQLPEPGTVGKTAFYWHCFFCPTISCGSYRLHACKLHDAPMITGRLWMT